LLLVVRRSGVNLLIVCRLSKVLCLGGLCPPPASPRGRWGDLLRRGRETTLRGKVTRAGLSASGGCTRA